jgi:hypothetical protein
MPPYPIFCYTKGCGRPAVYKIAARWSDGLTQELKTYALSCAECLLGWYSNSKQKQAVCRLAKRETLEVPGIFHLARGRRDAQIERLHDLERQLGAQGDTDGTRPSQPALEAREVVRAEEETRVRRPLESSS